MVYRIRMIMQRGAWQEEERNNVMAWNEDKDKEGGGG